MELFYLLCSILSAFFTSLVLSCLLPFRALLRCLCSARSVGSSATTGEDPVSLYEGTVWHERRRPVHHSFRYAVRYALVDIDSAPNVLPDHLSGDEARRIAGTTGPVFLLTIPPSVGYEQNPLSLYYCYDLGASTQNLKQCIAEVTNTPWGERVTFVFNPNFDLVAKPLHVSPFMDMYGNWSIKANVPGDNLLVAITVQHPKLGNYFTATLTAKKVSSSLVVDRELFFWLMPHKVAIWIYWHALKLWWKNVQFIHHPKCSNPAYREEASVRDRKLKCCQASGLGEDEHMLVGGSGPDFVADNYEEDRWFSWRDAKWPWC